MGILCISHGRMGPFKNQLTQAEIGLKNTEIQSKRTFDSP